MLRIPKICIIKRVHTISWGFDRETKFLKDRISKYIFYRRSDSGSNQNIYTKARRQKP